VSLVGDLRRSVALFLNTVDLVSGRQIVEELAPRMSLAVPIAFNPLQADAAYCSIPKVNQKTIGFSYFHARESTAAQKFLT